MLGLKAQQYQANTSVIAFNVFLYRGRKTSDFKETQNRDSGSWTGKSSIELITGFRTRFFRDEQQLTSKNQKFGPMESELKFLS